MSGNLSTNSKVVSKLLDNKSNKMNSLLGSHKAMKGIVQANATADSWHK